MNRPGAAVTAAGALLALLCQGTATAQEEERAVREVSGGYASWGPTFASATGDTATVTAKAPAVRGSGGRSWFPVDGGSVDPAAGDAVVDLDGSLFLKTSGADALTLGEPRLRLDGGTGALDVRVERAGETDDLKLAEIGTGAAPTVRSGGATWSGLKVSLTAEGAALLTEWSGRSYEEGAQLAPLDLTVGTGSNGSAPGTEQPQSGTEETPSRSPSPETGTGTGTGAEAGTTAEGGDAGETGTDAAQSAAVETPSLAPGAEQRVRGEGFEPGEVVLVAIDDDTRFQAVADDEGRVARAFPLYDTATEGAHNIRLYSVTGGREATAGFTVLAATPSA